MKCGSAVWYEIKNNDKYYNRIFTKLFHSVNSVKSPKFDTTKLQWMSPKFSNKVISMKRSSK